MVAPAFGLARMAVAGVTESGEARPPRSAAERDATLARGLRYQQRGQLRQAHDAYQAVLAMDPEHAEANHLLGLVLHRIGRADEAAGYLQRAVAAAPRSAVYRTNLGVILRDLGRLAEAAASYEAALDIDPQLAPARANLGVVLLGMGRTNEAVAAQREALRLQPDYPEAEANLGLALAAAGDSAGALAAYRRALALRPGYDNARVHLIAALREAGQLEEAEAVARTGIAASPTRPALHHGLGEVLAARGELEAAAASFRAALDIAPDAAAFRNLGRVLTDLGQFAEAAAAFRAAIEIADGDAVAHAGLGRALSEMGGMPRALESYRRALELDPGNARLRDAMAPALIAVGLIEEAESNYRAWLDRQPEALTPRRALVFTSNYGDQPAAETSRLAFAYGAALAQQVPARTRHRNAVDPARRLRVGLVSGDFNFHPVAYFLESVLAAIDGGAIELFAYANSRKADAMTERLRAKVPYWRSVAGFDDAELDGLVVADGIDILVDLAGYSGESRLGLLARKPAPVAVTWLGYSGTTGLAAIDYVLADRWVVPVAEEALYAERVWRLPDSYLCFTPSTDVEPVSPLPALANGYVTFGSFNNLNKVTDRALALWGRLLAAVPESRLMLKSTVLRRPGAPDETRERCVAAGIPAERLTLLPYQAAAKDHLAAYRDIDIGLDPFPYNGTTTTCEAMLMGVPVLTLRGDRFIAHVGESLNRTMGLDAWVAADADEFIARAVAFAGDLPGLAALRQGLRPRLIGSPLCDAPRFARHLEEAFGGMWRRWCLAQREA